MSENDIMILNSVIDEYAKDLDESFSGVPHFDLFIYEQILKDHELSYDEILDGHIDGGNDGGIDGFFSFLNGELYDEGTDLKNIKRSPVLEIFLIQSKTAKSFTETAIGKLIVTSSDIFDLGKDEDYLRKMYNPGLVEKMTEFKTIYKNIGKRHPVLKVHYCYATKGKTTEINKKVMSKAEILKKTILQHFTGAEATVKFLGARELLDTSRLEKRYTLELRLLENVLSRGGDYYIVLSSLDDYYNFIKDENGDLRRYIFESNVRDFQGSVQVNKEILKTLEANDDMDFWWLNNGITILVTKASVSGKVMSLDNVQIVNGLQTSFCIYDYLNNKSTITEKDETRSILLRIMKIKDSATQDRIIKATNSQTAMPPSSLRATDKIQRDIEAFFSYQGWFYDRRKNYYKNIGKSPKKIISIPYLAQAITAVLLREPNNARARPASLVKNDQDYKRVFKATLDFKVYLFCAKLLKRLDSFIRGEFKNHTITDRKNLKYHTSMVSIMKLTGKKNYIPKDFLKFEIENIPDDVLRQSLDETIRIGQEYAQKQKWTIERLAKNKSFVKHLISEISVT